MRVLRSSISLVVLVYGGMVVPGASKSFESGTKKNHEDQRDLFGSPGMEDFAAAMCQQELSVCEALTRDISEPAQKWIDFLERIDGDSEDTLVDDLQSIIGKSARVSFAPLVKGIRSLSRRERIGRLLGNLRSLSAQTQLLAESESTTEQRSANFYEVQSLLTEVSSLVGASYEGLGVITTVVTFAAELSAVAPQGPQAIQQFMVGSFVAFFLSFEQRLMSLALFPEADPICMEELMLCDYMRMMYQMVPALFGSLFLASEDL